jgi:cytochrome c-type biogenesis protein CcmH/NrfF
LGVRRIDFDTSMVLEYILPDSPSDFGAILLWVLMTLLLMLVILDVRLYLKHRKMPQKGEQHQQIPTTNEHMKQSEEENEQAFIDIRNKVDQLIEINNL